MVLFKVVLIPILLKTVLKNFDITTEEGYVNQLNKLYSKGSIDKEYYIEQVGILKNNYPNSYELIKNKLLMN